MQGGPRGDTLRGGSHPMLGTGPGAGQMFCLFSILKNVFYIIKSQTYTKMERIAYEFPYIYHSDSTFIKILLHITS